MSLLVLRVAGLPTSPNRKGRARLPDPHRSHWQEMLPSIRDRDHRGTALDHLDLAFVGRH
jgi:hypothetical protein